MEGKEELMEETPCCHTNILVCPLVALFALFEIPSFYYPSLLHPCFPTRSGFILHISLS